MIQTFFETEFDALLCMMQNCDFGIGLSCKSDMCLHASVTIGNVYLWLRFNEDDEKKKVSWPRWYDN